jgi:hypothetical protein
MVSFVRRKFRAVVHHAHGWPIPYRLCDDGGRATGGLNPHQHQGGGREQQTHGIEGGGRRLFRFIEHVLAKHLGWQG